VTLTLPVALNVQVHFIGEPNAPAAGVLVALDVFHQGRSYYATHVGVTDARGGVSRTGSELASDFREDQRLFPMDLRVPLERCDPVLRIRLDGGPEFEARRTAAMASGLVTPSAKARWQAARNLAIRPATVSVPLDTDGSSVNVQVEVERSQP